MNTDEKTGSFKKSEKSFFPSKIACASPQSGVEPALQKVHPRQM
jgi:hypothetical protein